MFEIEQAALEAKIRQFCVEQDLPVLPISWTWIPFGGEWGISTSFFQLAAAEARSGKKVIVPQRAAELAEAVRAYLGVPKGFERVEAVKGYLNLYFSSREYARRIISTVLEEGEHFGSAPRRSERVMVEFSQPNTHKAFHVGHLRSAILGDVLCRMLDAAGYEVIRANYPGDIGLHVVKWLWNYMKFHSGEQPPAHGRTRWMGDLYSEATKRLEESPELESEVRAVYTRWDQRDPEVVALWQETRQWSLDGFDEMYDLLGIRFDRYYFNSMAEQPGKLIVDELIEKKIARDERPDGPVFVNIDEVLGLKDEKYRVLVVLRSDGTALYATEDLALAGIKFTDYPDLVRCLYVVDVRQSLHFQQVFKVLDIIGRPWAGRLQHVPYELVSLPGNVAMSSREGTVVLLEDLIAEATRRALEIVETKNPELSPEVKQEIARAVAIGGIKYPMLSRDSTKIVTFDWQSALDINGQAAPYIQYAYVRAGSILRKVKGLVPDPAGMEFDLSKPEITLVDLISRIPGEVQRAAVEYRPILIANLAYDLAQAFNDFYNQCPVLQAEEPVRTFRLRLVAATRQAIANSLALLGITAPQAM